MCGIGNNPYGFFSFLSAVYIVNLLAIVVVFMNEQKPANTSVSAPNVCQYACLSLTVPHSSTSVLSSPQVFHTDLET